MMKTTSPALSSFLFIAALVGATLVTSDAFANGGFAETTKNVGTNVRKSVPLIPMISYVCGVFFTASGLLKLKDWINDGDRNPITPALTRLVVATFLILLPHMIRLTTGTLFRRADGSMHVNVPVVAQNLGAFQKTK